MKTFLTKYFNLFFLLSCFCSTSLFSSVQEILSLCDTLDNRIRNVKNLSDDVSRKIRNISYGLGDGRNLTFRDIYGMQSALDDCEQINTYLVNMSSEVGQIRAYANSLDNSSSVSTNSTDLTEIITRLDMLNTVVSNLNNEVGNIRELYMDYMAWFTENQDKLTNYLDNWGNFTNSLPSSFFYNYLTNSFSRALLPNYYGNSMPAFRFNFSSKQWLDLPNASLALVNPYINVSQGIFDKSRFRTLSDYFYSIMANQVALDGGILSTLYTNTQNTISFHRDYQKDFKSYSDFTTNKITEINSIFYNNSPLDDLQADVNPSNIYNFVTNYYIKVSTDPSGSASENKTNWFNRIEMLLSALVFRPAETATSNNFDNATETQSQAFSDSLKSVLNDDITEVQSKSTDVKENFENTKDSLLRFFNHLDDKLSSLATMPSHIEFFEISVKGEKKKVQITTTNTFGRLADAFRSITTLCWVSFFLYLIYVISIWLFHRFATILKFCYAVFKTLIGIG